MISTRYAVMGSKLIGRKNMKKIICLILVLSLVAGFCAASSVVAQEYNPDDPDYPFIKYYKFGESNGYDICLINASPEIMICKEVIGDYLFVSSLVGDLFKDPLGIYAVKDNDIIYIKEAYELGLIDIGEVAQMINGFDQHHILYSTARLGDVDINGRLEIKDVLEIQKVVAKITEIKNVFELYDKNKDGEITVADAVKVQKQIAKIEV